MGAGGALAACRSAARSRNPQSVPASVSSLGNGPSACAMPFKQTSYGTGKSIAPGTNTIAD